MNAPTLLVGLGGKGGDIIERVAAMVTDEERENIAFVVFDTDINELRKIQERNPFVKIIQTSVRQTVGEYLQRYTYARDTWFPVHPILNPKTLTEGAGQVRAISRLAIDSVIRAGKMEPLHEAVQSLYKMEEDKADQALRVIITGSLVGGTGSGLILPISMYIRNYLKTHFRQSANITRGFFLLPEVFFEVIKGPAERKNIQANAYATLRELDAFLMKSDGTLPKRYKDSVKLEFPKILHEGYEEYDVTPFDFCFLFDAQNAEGGKLNSFNQYIDHAANCIYAQSIGPMNKRSNSSEDNTIRKLAKEQGRNRYAGAGVSMLIYPFKDIKKYLALTWAKQNISRQWLQYDNKYKDYLKDKEEKLNEGIVEEDLSVSGFYVQKIDEDFSNDDVAPPPFSGMIYKSARLYEDGIYIDDKWTAYTSALEETVEKRVRDETNDVTLERDQIRTEIAALGISWNDYINVYDRIRAYKDTSYKYASMIAQTSGYTLFNDSKEEQSEDARYNLKSYLLDAKREFLHPNAIRYILIKIYNEMISRKEHFDAEKKQLKETQLDNFERNTFDDPKTEQIEDRPEDLRKQKIWFERFRKNPTGNQEDIKSQYSAFIDNIEKFNILEVKGMLFKTGIKYIGELIKGYEIFYGTLDTKISSIDKEVEKIYKRYSETKGSAVRYVCASKKCLDKISKDRPYTGGIIKADPVLSGKIYDEILKYASSREKPANNYWCAKIFDEDIIGYFEDSVMTRYGNNLDIDVISALEYESECLRDSTIQSDSYDATKEYIRKAITDTRGLACPFIETPLGEPQDPIDACTFNINMKPDATDNSPIANLIRKELMNFGGEPDEDIPKYMIMFYKSFYGLRANSFSKFAPPEKAATYNREGGEYFKAYYDLIEGIHPTTEESKEINPHIDCHWHSIEKLPDLDEINQKKQEYKNYRAFLWALLAGYIYLEDVGNGKKIYKLRKVELEMDDDELIVSNGTECDNLYEVLDAISIYPRLAGKIDEKVQSLIKYEKDKSRNKSARKKMIEMLDAFELKEPGIGKEKKPSRSIFDIPMLMKKDSVPEEFFEENVLELLKVELEEIRRYLSEFYTDLELPDEMEKIITEQFNRHVDSLKEECNEDPRVCTGTLFVDSFDIIKKSFVDLELIDKADYVEEKKRELRSGS